jgi:HK97 family phage portal protein
MAFWSRWLPSRVAVDAPARIEPYAAVQSASGGVLITTPDQLAEYLQEGSVTAAGVPVSPDVAMRDATVYACIRIRSGLPATLPLDIKRRVDAKTREDASDTRVAQLLRRKPNRWQTPSQFKRMLQAHNLLRGNGYAMIVWSRGEPIEMIPMHPDRVKCEQLDDLSLKYTYTRRDGRTVILKQSEVFHLVGLTLDGVHGVTPMTYARETVGLSLAQMQAGASVFRNGPRASVVLEHPARLGEDGRANIRASLDEYRAGGDSEGKALILEEGMKIGDLSMTAEDAQWIESRKFSRTDLAMFWGVPPFLIGDTEKSTSWGSGIEQQTQGFLTFSAEDDLTMWEETIQRDLIVDPASPLYARYNRAALVKGDIKTRTASYASALQWGWLSPDEVRALEDMNPREDGEGGRYYDPPNTAGNTTGDKAPEDKTNEPSPTP